MKRGPDFVIGDPENPYLLRWWVIPRNRFFNIYRHRILRNDDDRALHDHPWWNVSIVLKGELVEIIPAPWQMRTTPHQLIGKMWTHARHLKRGSIVFRKATAAHRLEVRNGPVETLFITGPVIRDWGFHCPQGWKHWRLFTAADNPGQVGKGCED